MLSYLLCYVMLINYVNCYEGTGQESRRGLKGEPAEADYREEHSLHVSRPCQRHV